VEKLEVVRCFLEKADTKNPAVSAAGFLAGGLHAKNGGCRGETHAMPALTCGQTECQRNMRLARAAVAEQQDVFAAIQILASCQLQHQRLVERRDGQESE